MHTLWQEPVGPFFTIPNIYITVPIFGLTIYVSEDKIPILPLQYREAVTHLNPRAYPLLQKKWVLWGTWEVYED